MKPTIMRWYDTDECLPSCRTTKLVRAIADSGNVLYLYAQYHGYEWKMSFTQEFGLIPIIEITHWAHPLVVC